MALTRETITANECLSGLTDEQVTAIVRASENDENEVVGKRVGEIHRQYDADIKESTGIERQGDEKTYNYLKRAVGQALAKYADYEETKGKVNTLAEENKKLKEQIANGGDEAARTQLESAQKELTATKSQYSELKEKFDQLEQAHAKEMNDYKINSEIANAESRLHTRPGLNEMAVEALKREARANILAKHPSFEERGGRSVLVYHDEDGSPLNNKEHQLEPFTTEELLAKEYEKMDLLDKKSKGAGGKGEKPKNLAISASTQTEAEGIIRKELSAKGLVRGSEEYQAEMDRMWKENEIAKLPLK